MATNINSEIQTLNLSVKACRIAGYIPLKKKFINGVLETECEYCIQIIARSFQEPKKNFLLLYFSNFSLFFPIKTKLHVQYKITASKLARIKNMNICDILKPFKLKTRDNINETNIETILILPNKFVSDRVFVLNTKLTKKIHVPKKKPTKKLCLHIEPEQVNTGLIESFKNAFS